MKPEELQELHEAMTAEREFSVDKLKAWLVPTSLDLKRARTRITLGKVVDFFTIGRTILDLKVDSVAAGITSDYRTCA